MKEKCFIFSADYLGRRSLPLVMEHYDVLGFLDNNAALQGTKIEGVKIVWGGGGSPVEVFSPEILKTKKCDLVVMAIGVGTEEELNIYRDINKQLSSYGIKKIIHFTKLPKPFSRHIIDIHLTEHCNLNCAYCMHFSNIANKEFYDIERFEKDLKRLSKLTNKDVGLINLLGGEPLLNPDVTKLIDICRKIFNKVTKIMLTTNGILLTKMPVEFWNCIQRNGVSIFVSRYPIKLDAYAIRELSIKYSVQINYGDNPFINILNTVPKAMAKLIFDLKGKGNLEENFSKCSFGNRCLTLKKGRLYSCCVAAHSEHFYNKFKHLKESPKDSIDIHKAKSEQELSDFVASPIPFCRFCKEIKYGFDWKPTKKSIKEWT